VSERTIRNWRTAEGGRPGRPPRSEAERRAAFRLVVRAWRWLGRSAGWRKVHGLLGVRVPVRLVQECLRVAKRLDRAHVAAGRAARRISVVACFRNVLWHVDATHLGRTAREEVQGQAVRDAAEPEVLAASVGRVVTTDDAILAVEAAIVVAGAPPLVLSTDGGSPYTSERFEAVLRGHKIVHLRNLPHTPQHNARAERVFRDLKEDSGLGRGVVLASASAAAAPFAAACACMARRARLRAQPSRPPMRYTPEDRARFHETVRRRVERAVQCAPDARAARLAEREAIFAVLEERRLIRRTRGGARLARRKAEIKS
jgi:transposase InsO family protein